jgi:hypothetical protein
MPQAVVEALICCYHSSLCWCWALLTIDSLQASGVSEVEFPAEHRIEVSGLFGDIFLDILVIVTFSYYVILIAYFSLGNKFGGCHPQNPKGFEYHYAVLPM